MFQYFEGYKLSANYTGQETNLAANFMGAVTIASQVPNFLFNWVNVFVQLGGNLTTRVVWSIFIEVVLFVFTVIMAMSDTSDHPEAFFYATIGTVIILNGE